MRHKSLYLLPVIFAAALPACSFNSVIQTSKTTPAKVTAVTAPYILPNAAPEITGLQWQRVENMSDEFNGNTIDLNKWQVEPVGNGWGWLGRAPGLFKAENVSVADGSMNVEVSALAEPVQIKDKTFSYQGAIVRSLQAGQPGWYFEAKMKANATEMSSTFWLMTKGNTVKKLELDIQECVGAISPEVHAWAKNWDHIFHSNAIHRTNKYNKKHVQKQGSKNLVEKNHERYFVYAAWWKSANEVRFYLDGEYAYSITPSIDWDVPAFYQMAIETYDWNPVPADGGLVKKGTKEQRTTKYDWIRTWRVKN